MLPADLSAAPETLDFTRVLTRSSASVGLVLDLHPAGPDQVWYAGGLRPGLELRRQPALRHLHQPAAGPLRLSCQGFEQRRRLERGSFYGILALVFTVLPGSLASHLLAGWLLNLMNVVDNSFRFGMLFIPSRMAVAIQVAVGLVVPLVAALVPVIGGARITPHQAISSYGLGAGFGRGWLDRLTARVRRLPRPLALSLRNTFRRKARITLTLLTLILGGAMFIVVLSVGTSMSNTIEVLINDFGFDVLVVFDRPHRAGRLIEATSSVDGVARAEVWDVRGGTVELDNGEEIQGQLWGVPDNSQMFNPRIISGRALLPDDGRAILLNSKIASGHDIKVGETVTLTVAEEELTWTVVGLILNVNNLQRDNFVPFDTLAKEIGNANRGAFVMMGTEAHDFETHERIIRDLRAVCEAQRLKPVFFQSGGELRQQTKAQFDMIVYLMLAMAILAAIVGAVGLMTTMSIKVVERGRHRRADQRVDRWSRRDLHSDHPAIERGRRPGDESAADAADTAT